MFIKTANGKVYSSNTNGATFVYQTAGLLGAGNNDVLQVVYQEGSESVILQGWGANNWATRDMGDSWINPAVSPVSPTLTCFSSPVGDSGGYIASLIRMHPHDPKQAPPAASLAKPASTGPRRLRCSRVRPRPHVQP